jgi:hypothetical protein
MKILLLSLLISNSIFAQRIQATAWATKSNGPYNIIDANHNYVAGMTKGSWMEYTIMLEPGSYMVTLNGATTVTGVQYQIATAVFNMKNTGDWTRFEGTSDTFQLTQTATRFRVTQVSDPSANFESIEITPVGGYIPPNPPQPGLVTTDTLATTAVKYIVSGTNEIKDRTVRYLLVTSDKAQYLLAPIKVVDDTGMELHIHSVLIANKFWMQL